MNQNLTVCPWRGRAAFISGAASGMGLGLACVLARREAVPVRGTMYQEFACAS